MYKYMTRIFFCRPASRSANGKPDNLPTGPLQAPVKGIGGKGSLWTSYNFRICICCGVLELVGGVWHSVCEVCVVVWVHVSALIIAGLGGEEREQIRTTTSKVRCNCV